MTKAFDNKKYLNLQVKEIKTRLQNFNKIYLEIGGHLVSDNHAARVLNGYKKNNKLKILDKIKKDIEIYYCIYYKHLTKNAVDHSIKKYKKDVLNEIKFLKKKYNLVGIIITRNGPKNESVEKFITKILKQNIKVYKTKNIKDYPENINYIIGKNGFEKQPYLKTTKKIIIITGHVSNSGKMATCLSQIYHDSKNKINSGYFKLETFPIWNLPLNHPVNLAYESATADIGDANKIDPYHKKYYNKEVVNYNRDIENFKILKKIITKIITKNNFMHNYKSPTDMGINCAGFAITNDKKIRECAKNEILRRFKKYNNIYKINKNRKNLKTIERVKQIIKEIKK
jgi:uncharacterized protein (UPF0371 family)